MAVAAMIETVTGNLMDSKEKYLCHQTNCVTNRSAHLAQAVFKAFPYADIYKGRTAHDKPGTIVVKGDGKDQRYVINMLGQYYPGSPRFPNSAQDGGWAREQYFEQCLAEIAKLPDLESVAFPHGIGCGAAGGNWGNYEMMITEFAGKVPNTKVVIYKLPTVPDSRLGYLLWSPGV